MPTDTSQIATFFAIGIGIRRAECRLVWPAVYGRVSIQQCRVHREQALEKQLQINQTQQWSDDKGGPDPFTFPIVTVGAVFTIVVLTPMAHIFHFAVSIIWASRTVALTITVATIIIAITTIILVRRIVPTGSMRGRRSPAPRRTLAITTATRSWSSITAGVEAPGRRRRRTCPLLIYDEPALFLFRFSHSETEFQFIPRSLICRLVRGVYYASHDKHHRHHDDFHTLRMQNCWLR